MMGKMTEDWDDLTKALQFVVDQTITRGDRLADKVEELETMMGQSLPTWTKIEKGDKRPLGRVLVSYDYTDPLEPDAKVKRWGVTGAWWNAKRQHWVADHGKPVGGVTHWMPMPELRRD